MFINSHIASGYLIGRAANLNSKWITLLIISTIFPDIDGLWSNTVAGHHSILHTMLFWILILGLALIFGKLIGNRNFQKMIIIIFCGIIVHLITDWLTSRTVGIKWLYPFSDKDYFLYSIEPSKGDIPIWQMIIPPYFTFYCENKTLFYGELIINFLAIGLFGKKYLNKKKMLSN